MDFDECGAVCWADTLICKNLGEETESRACVIEESLECSERRIWNGNSESIFS